jgi:hypothetical protein
MLNVTTGRFIWTFLVGFFICSNLNWGIAEFFLNDWATPRLDGFMRTGSIAASGANISKMMFGFMLPLLASAWLFSTTDKPAGWVARAIYCGMLISIAAFFGTYTFISGWGNVNWVPLMVIAFCDTISIVPGTLLIAWLQNR